MMDHSQCAHARTPKDRAKCRKGQVGFHPPLFSLGPPPAPKRMGKAPKEDDDSYGQTPRERWMECDNCGVERIAYRGTDSLTNVLRYVGPKCLYTIQRAPDLEALQY